MSWDVGGEIVHQLGYEAAEREPKDPPGAEDHVVRNCFDTA